MPRLTFEPRGSRVGRHRGSARSFGLLQHHSLAHVRSWNIIRGLAKSGGCLMTIKLALCTALTVMVFSGAVIDASAQTYEVTKLVPGSAFHGVHGLGIDKGGRLFAGSVAGAALYEVDRSNGTARIAIPGPEGMADDIAFAPDGTMAWTGFLTG